VWAVLSDLATIYSTARARDWVACAAAVNQLIADLGITLGDAEMRALVRCVQVDAEARTILSRAAPTG